MRTMTKSVLIYAALWVALVAIAAAVIVRWSR